jgi:NTE family protein
MVTTAFVLSGGGSLGAVQVGMLQALAAHDVRPDLLVGTSAGAMNAAWVAGHGMSADSLVKLAQVWIGLRRREIFPVQPRQVLSGLLGRRTGVVSDAGLRRLVGAHVVVEYLTQARVPTHLLAADLLSGQRVPISTGDPVDAVLASAAIPGIFPPVQRAGRHLVDGSVALHAGVSQAVDLGATVLYVLPTGAPCALPGAPQSAIGVALHSLNLLIAQRLIHEIAGLRGAATIKVLPPLCPLEVSAADFRHAAQLIARARRASLEWIDSGDIDLPAAERFLALHHHRPKGLDDVPRNGHQGHGVASGGCRVEARDEHRT